MQHLVLYTVYSYCNIHKLTCDQLELVFLLLAAIVSPIHVFPMQLCVHIYMYNTWSHMVLWHTITRCQICRKEVGNIYYIMELWGSAQCDICIGMFGKAQVFHAHPCLCLHIVLLSILTKYLDRYMHEKLSDLYYVKATSGRFIYSWVNRGGYPIW